MIEDGTDYQGFLAEVGRRLNEISYDMTENALTEAAIIIQGHTAPIVPVATSNLLNSLQREIWRVLGGWEGAIYFTAEYAPYVHKAPGVLKGKQVPRHPARLGNYWDPAGEPQFFEKGVNKSTTDILNSLRRLYGNRGA